MLINALAIKNSLPSTLSIGIAEIPIFSESRRNPMLKITTSPDIISPCRLTVDPPSTKPNSKELLGLSKMKIFLSIPLISKRGA